MNELMGVKTELLWKGTGMIWPLESQSLFLLFVCDC